MSEQIPKIKKYLLTIFLILIAFIFGWTISKYYHDKITPKNFVDMNQEEVGNYVGDIYKNMNNDLYSSITDKDFVNFATSVIEKKCPFYKPDGVTYRTCLSDWEQSLEDKNMVEQNDEVHAYCSKFTNKYAEESSLEGQELFLKCAIYKLQ